MLAGVENLEWVERLRMEINWGGVFELFGKLIDM